MRVVNLACAVYWLAPGQEMQCGAPSAPRQGGDSERPHDGRAVLVTNVQKNADQSKRANNRRANAAAIIENFACTNEHITAL